MTSHWSSRRQSMTKKMTDFPVAWISGTTKRSTTSGERIGRSVVVRDPVAVVPFDELAEGQVALPDLIVQRLLQTRVPHVVQLHRPLDETAVDVDPLVVIRALLSADGISLNS